MRIKNVIPPFDAIHKLFVENQVVMMKYNPVNANIAFWVDKLFKELIDDGFYASVGGIFNSFVLLIFTSLIKVNPNQEYILSNTNMQIHST